jgi:glycosyltransferase involved in cell wall biosynthesis
LIFNKLVEINPAAELIIVGKDVSDIISLLPLGENDARTVLLQKLCCVSIILGCAVAAIQPHINAATVVFPFFAEALPVSWIEAMALKKIVASNIGWATDVIDDGINGFWYTKEHSLYATKINSILENAALQQRLGLAAREKAYEI